MRFSKQISIYLYGYVQIARKVYANLTDQGYHACGYIDRNAKKICEDESNLAIFSLEEMKMREKEDTLIIIFVRHILSHEEIADVLYSQGYSYLLFFPTAKHMKQECANLLRNIWNLVYDSLFEDIEDIEIPKYEDCYHLLFDSERSVISRTKSTVVVWCPWEILYCSTVEYRKKDAIENHLRNSWLDCDIPIIMSRNYMGLMQYHDNLDENDDAIKKYLQERIDALPINESFKTDKELKNRMEVLDLMSRELNRGLDYFINSPAMAQWNNQGYFNLIDGQHRSLLLISRGFKYVPIRIRNGDYNKWLNKRKLIDCLNVIKKYKIRATATPIPNPAFFDFPSRHEMEKRTILATMQRILIHECISEKNILEISSYNSYFARHFCLMGGYKAASYEPNLILQDLANALNSLLYVDNVEIFNSIKELNQVNRIYQIVCIISPSEEMITDEELHYVINSYTNGMIFWQSRSENYCLERKGIQSNTKYKFYKKIFCGFNGEYLSEFGMFSQYAF